MGRHSPKGGIIRRRRGEAAVALSALRAVSRRETSRRGAVLPERRALFCATSARSGGEARLCIAVLENRGRPVSVGQPRKAATEVRPLQTARPATIIFSV